MFVNLVLITSFVMFLVQDYVRNMPENMYVYKRRHKSLVSTLNSSGESQVFWVPPTPQNVPPPTRRHSASRVRRFSGDHEHSATVHELPVQVIVNSSSERSCWKNSDSQCDSSSPNCVIAPSESAGTDIAEYKFVDSVCNVEKSGGEVEKERVLGGDGHKEVLFKEEGHHFNGLQTCLPFGW